MDLPLDHFRLLGVSPATDAQTVLRTLQLRLDRPPEQGYTVETLEARADLLRASADLLSDGERRAAYESDLTALADGGEPLMPALEIPSSREVAGLLLLLEADQPLEAFQLACRALQPPQAPALGSGREADLTLLAGEAALAAAAEQSQQRHYEQAARTLQQCLQLLQRMGQMPELRERIHAQLEGLAPFRVLDLLSRDPAAVREREEGLSLLEQLVQRRGGLEGKQDDGFAPEDFQTFFKQIRSFLTVQEQLDVFQRWGKEGSGAAAFLHTIALTASGFAQRKPERIAAAREQLVASGREGLQPLLANLDLLLGDVEGAIQGFSSGAGPDLRAWAERQSSDPLAQVCAWCRDWLGRDVLPGYRDLDADADLEAYFSDRDVLAWVEREDRRRGRSFNNEVQPSDSGAATAALNWPDATGLPSHADDGDGSSAFGGFGGPLAAPFDTGLEPSASAGAGRGRPKRGAREPGPGAGLRLPGGRLRAAWLLPLLGAGGLALATLAGGWLLRSRPERPATQSSIAVQAPAATPAKAPQPPGPTAPPPPPMAQAGPPGAPPTAKPPAAPPAAAASPTASGGSLTSAEPSEAELKAMLERWLQAKTTVLAGGSAPAGLDLLARQGAIEQLNQQRALDSSRGLSQSIAVQVKSVTIRESAPRRIALEADLAYSDSTRDRSGKVVARTAPTSLRNVYVFGRDSNGWRLVATRPAG